MTAIVNKYDLPPQAENNNLDINPPPLDDNYIGYIYRWTNLNTGRWYIGKRKRKLSERVTYDFGSTDEEFCSDFTNSNIKWRLEIMEYVDYIKPKKTILTNLHTDLDYKILTKKLPKNVTPGYDGLTLLF